MSRKNGSDRDVAIARFIRRNGNIGFAAPVSEIFTNGKPADHILRQLAKNGWLTLYSKAANGYTYGQLTSFGLKQIGVDVTNVRKATPTTIDVAIASGWFCALDGDQRRYRLLSAEIEERYGDAVPKNVPHFITTEFGDEPTVLRFHHATGKVSTTKSAVRAFFQENRSKAGIAASIVSKSYGMVCLCPTQIKCEQVLSLLNKNRLFELGRLVVALGPTVETFGSCLKGRQM